MVRLWRGKQCRKQTRPWSLRRRLVIVPSSISVHECPRTELWRLEKSLASRLQAQARSRASRIEEETGAQEREDCLYLIRNQSEAKRGNAHLISVLLCCLMLGLPLSAWTQQARGPTPLFPRADPTCKRGHVFSVSACCVLHPTVAVRSRRGACLRTRTYIILRAPRHLQVWWITLLLSRFVWSVHSYKIILYLFSNVCHIFILILTIYFIKKLKL
jgi:hypothetical protein